MSEVFSILLHNRQRYEQGKGSRQDLCANLFAGSG